MDKMKIGDELISSMTKDTIIYNLHQIQHILNDLIKGKTLKGNELNSQKILEYKLSVIKTIWELSEGDSEYIKYSKSRFKYEDLNIKQSEVNNG